MGLMARSLCLSQALVMMRALGQNAKYSPRVNVVRFASELGHCAMRSALRIRANDDFVSPSPLLEVHHSRVRLLCCGMKFVHTGKFNSFVENCRA
jgi:hypothetical protein